MRKKRKLISLIIPSRFNMLPKVSIIWLNYNSLNNIDIIKFSLEKCMNLDYPNYEVIVVDNGSTDGSFKVIKEIAEKKNNFKVIRLEENLGFCGGNNVGYRARDPNSKYVVLLNNDCIPEENSLLKLVEFMEEKTEIGASQGIVLNYNNNDKIDTAGGFVFEFLASHVFLQGEDLSLVKNIKKPFYISYADGCYSIYRVSAIKKIRGESLFYDEFFSYFDDNFIGLKLWNGGFKVACLPEVVGEHIRSMSFGKKMYFQEYLGLRGHIALLYITNSYYNKILFKYALYMALLFRDGYRVSPAKFKLLIRAIRDGKNLGKMLRERGEFININNIPKIRYDLKNLLLGLLLSHRSSIAKEFHKIGNRWILERIDNFYIE